MIDNILTGHHSEVLGVNKRNLDYIYPNNGRRYFSLVDEKLRTKEIAADLGVPVPRTYLTFKDFRELISFEDQIKAYENFVIKPNKGHGGHGILIIGDRTANGYLDVHENPLPFRKLKRQVSDILMGAYSYGMNDTAVIEERIFPSSFLMTLYPQGLADIRIILYMEQPIMGMLRIPTSLSEGKANLHQRGIGVGLDLSTGKTIHALYKGKSITKHPDTHQDLIDLELPFIKEILDICKIVAAKIPLKYLGFDLTLDEKIGPMLIEINARPGLEIQNVTQKGLLEVLKRV
ncbi:MAG TPA: alpha-L-glutamate ligase-like protein [Spirochaetes bacterium]|nr:alpha-L-glutamate ligase-like protein [Spirochaetota bacterium]